LYKDITEIISELQPEFIVAENVKALRSMLKGKVEDKIKADIRKLGYVVNVTVLNSADYYVPQRERIILLQTELVKKFSSSTALESDSYITNKRSLRFVKLKDNPKFNQC
jgi:DNA (cytosine-5)-methyltransferase 1